VLAGFGLATTGALLGQGAEAAPSPKAKPSPIAACMKQCNRTAKETRRNECAGLKSKAKNTCLREVATARAECRRECHAPEPEV
jgi:hypothetical protein